MNPSFHIIDFVIVGIYAILLVGVGLWVSRTKKGHTKTAEAVYWMPSTKKRRSQ